MNRRKLLSGAACLASVGQAHALGLGRLGAGFGKLGALGGGGSGAAAHANFFANTGASTPYFQNNVHPHSFYVPGTGKTWFGWEAYNGVYRTEQVTTLDETTGNWSPIYDMLVSGSFNNSHPNPSICRDADGYVHAFSGHHPFPLNHSVTKNPDDPSAWVIQPPLVGSGGAGGLAYPHCYLIGSTFYLFVMADPWSQIWLYKSTSITNGVVTWASPVVIMDMSDGTGGTDTANGRAYMGAGIISGTSIHFVQTRSDPNDTFRRGLYRWTYNTTNGSVSNLGATVTTASGSLPLNLTTLNASYRVRDNTDNTTASWGPAFTIDANGNQLMMFVNNVSGTYTISSLKFADGVLGSLTTIDTSTDVPDGDFVSMPNGDVHIYYDKANAFSTVAEGDIWHSVLANGSSVWSTPTLIQAGTSGVVLGEPEATVGANGKARIMWAQSLANFDDTNPTGKLQIYAYGDSGFVKRPASSFPSPWPIVTGLPATTWNPSNKSSTVTLVGNNMLASSTFTTGAGSANVMSTTGRTSGKVHVEFLIQQHVGNAGAGALAIGLASNLHSPSVVIGGDTASFGLYDDGNVYFNNGLAHTVGSSALLHFLQGHWYAMEIDLGGGLAWWKNITLNGNYNDSGTANPATGVGGIPFPAITGTSLFLAAETDEEYAGIVLNVGEFPYRDTPSAGFGNW